MRLYLVQHGEAVAEEQDPARPLSERGRNEVQAVGTLLRQSGVRVEQMYHSGKTRARQTAELLAESVCQRGNLLQIDGIGPKDDPQPFLAGLAGWNHDTMVVGHLPFMGRAVCRLLASSEDPVFVAFRPGSLVCLEQAPGDRWSLCWMLRPELVR